jgi:hypothetical protein
MQEFPNAIRFIQVPELRALIPCDLARTTSKSLPLSEQQNHDEVSTLREVNEVYGFIVDKIKSAPEPGIPSVEVLSISPRDSNPDRDARMNYMRKIWTNRHARYKTTYSQTK